ncbi:helix-turn-helix domain-containing protein [Streptomyces sp. NPDC051644]|uniref:helix-turn-helix domain-containing protein n=1 Tax=Streptomyces sp. NPDC051644 TaxID=3365666 RepID=UPI0037B5867D
MRQLVQYRSTGIVLRSVIDGRPTVDVVQLRYAFRLEPGPGQRLALQRAFGCARVVFNDCLRARKQAHEQGLPYPTSGELSKRFITEAKKTPERSWLGEVSSVVLQQSLRDPDTAYRTFSQASREPVGVRRSANRGSSRSETAASPCGSPRMPGGRSRRTGS